MVKISWLLLAALVLGSVTGCRHLQPSSSQNQSPALPAPKPATNTASPVVKSPKVVFAETTVGGLRVRKTMPPEVAAGDEFGGELTITAQGRVTNVVVREAIPAGATYVRSEPAAAVEGRELVWKLGNVNAAQSVKMKAWFHAETADVPSSVTSVNAEPRISASVAVGAPMLALEVNGPGTVVLGADVAHVFVVKNIGSTVVRGVTLADTVPVGLSHKSGKKELLSEVGDLSPGQVKSITVALKAVQRGKVCCTAVVTSANAAKVSREICTSILVPGFNVEMIGSKDQIIGRNADYEISVTNIGDTTLKDVLISDVAPEECFIIAAPGANISGHNATWTIAELKPGAKVATTIKLTAKQAGTSCNTVTVSAGSVSDSAKACTLWKGVPAVTFELAENPDPIQIGESATYTIKIINQGSADIHNVKTAAVFDDLILPISSPQGTVTGQHVMFPVVATIGAKQSLTWTIVVKGTAAGDSRNKVELSCDELKSPVVREESTMIY